MMVTASSTASRNTCLTSDLFAPIFTNAKQIPKATCWLRRRFCGAAGVGHGRTSEKHWKDLTRLSVEFSSMGIPPHPNFDYLTIETHGFRDAPSLLKSSAKIEFQTRLMTS